jgi:hypothetical protein
MAFSSEFGKWSGSAVNAASESKISHHEAALAIDAANGPTYFPPSGSLSLDVSGALDAFSGGSFAIGIAIGTNNETSRNQDICVYYTLCEHSGIGYAAGLSLSGTVSGSGLSPGKQNQKECCIREEY